MTYRQRGDAVVKFLVGAFCLLSLFLAGCGGSGRSTSTPDVAGRLTLTVVWPQQKSRFVPVASKSIVAEVTDSNMNPISGQRQVLTSPGNGNTSTVTFTGLNPGSVHLFTTAYPNSDGSGNPQSSGNSPATIVTGQTAHVDVNMVNTVVTMAITPSNPSVTIGSPITLTVTPEDADGDTVLIDPRTVTWTSSATSEATVGSSPSLTTTLTGVAVGSGITLTVKDSESGGNFPNGTTAASVVTGGPPPATGPISSVVDRTGKFLYVIDDSTPEVSQFAINQDGTLSPLSPATIPLALAPISIRATPAPGPHTIYVGASDNTNGAIYQFSVQSNGTLAFLSPNSPSATAQPQTLAIDPAGKYLYDLDHNDGIRSYLINSDGTLAQNGADLVQGMQLFAGVVTPDGSHLYANGQASIGGPGEYLIGSSGTLTFVGRTSTSTGTQFDLVMTPDGLHLYAPYDTVGAGGMDLYNVASDATVSRNGSPVSFSLLAYKCVITPNGKFLYLVALNSPDNVVAQYAVNSDGTLTSLSPATVAAGNHTTSVSVTPDGGHLYVTNNHDGTVSQYSISANGTLVPLSPAAVPG